eukprot:TRINITY_DN2356_c0_g1_i1.p1 TRINITY_DN2356_c0_g1~~TRINITY_DN2356_c0_g1_i1.p1  ORF type:complete len:773 (-),score=108.73 TRINITY_DN2356_c0_g1_i1:36-2354(-)
MEYGGSFISCGWYHSVAITDHSTMFCWGNNYYGQLGAGNTNHIKNNHLEREDILFISCGENFSVAITYQGNLISWGRNENGQLGLGSLDDEISPQPIEGIQNVRFVACGKYHSLAITEDGRLYAWGWNKYGQLGTGNTVDCLTPILVETIGRVSFVSCGGYHSIAIDEDGNLFSWGRNNYGQLGLGNRIEYHDPQLISDLQNIKYVSCGNSLTIVINHSGDLYSWGRNDYGQLGLGHKEHQSVPRHIPSLSNIKFIACSGHSLAITQEGQLYSWGWNKYGQLGLGHKNHQTTPQLIRNLENVQYVFCHAHSIAYTKDDQLYSWGYNQYGQLGLESTENEYLPQRITCLKNVRLKLQNMATQEILKVRLLLENILKYYTPDDVISVHETQFPYHEFILQSRCPSILESLHQLSDGYVSPAVVDHLIQYIYTDIFLPGNIVLLDLFMLWRYAVNFKLAHLEILVRQYIRGSICTDNAVQCAELSFKFGLLKELYTIIRCIERDKKALLGKIKMSEYSVDILSLLVDNEEICLEELFLTSKYLNDLEDVLKDRKYSDLILLVTDRNGSRKDVKVHKAILSAQSEYFDMLIRRSYTNREEYHETPLSLESFCLLIDYWYLNTIEFSIVNCLELISHIDIYLCRDSQLEKMLSSRITYMSDQEIETAKDMISEMDYSQLQKIQMNSRIMESVLGPTVIEKSNRIADLEMCYDKLLESEMLSDINEKIQQNYDRIISLDNKIEQRMTEFGERLSNLEKTMAESLDNIFTKLQGIVNDD